MSTRRQFMQRMMLGGGFTVATLHKDGTCYVVGESIQFIVRELMARSLDGKPAPVPGNLLLKAI